MTDNTKLLKRLDEMRIEGFIVGLCEDSAKAIRTLQKRDRVVGEIAEGRRKEVVKLREQVQEYDKVLLRLSRMSNEVKPVTKKMYRAIAGDALRRIKAMAKK